jgi:hypothetical protein
MLQIKKRYQEVEEGRCAVEWRKQVLALINSFPEGAAVPAGDAISALKC